MKVKIFVFWFVLSFCLFCFLPTINPAVKAQVSNHSPLWNVEWSKYIKKQINSDNLLLVLELEKQKLSLFKKKENGQMQLIKSYLVITGKNSTPTPQGFFSLNSNDYVPRGMKMTGSYGQVTVHYWFGVVGDKIGIHDAPWRKDEEFLSIQGRSRGCINITRDSAQDLHSRVRIGTKILITR